MVVPPHLTHLLEHLRGNGLVIPLDCDPSRLTTFSGEDVRRFICSGDTAWRDLVPPEVAAVVDRKGYFGARCPIEGSHGSR